MTKVPHHKRAGKLNRNEYLVVRVGDQFFAGYVVSETVVPVEPKVKIATNASVESYWGRLRAPFIRRKKTSFSSKPTTKVVEQKRELKLVSEITDAKRYRRINQAEAACDMLNRHYNGIAKATVEYQGETK